MVKVREEIDDGGLRLIFIKFGLKVKKKFLFFKNNGHFLVQNALSTDF
jgi:hypothetical protein